MEKKTDLLLIHQSLETPHGNFQNVHPLGFFSIADTLQKNGLGCRILNIAVEKAIAPSFSIDQYVLRTNPSVIGIGLHWYVHLYNVIELARRIQKISPAKIVLGGYTASIFAKDILKNYPFVDAVIDGEGEMPVLLFVQKVLKNEADFSNVPNLIFRNHQGEIEKSKKTFQATAEELNSYDYSNIEPLSNFKKYFELINFAPIANHYYLPNAVNSIVQLAVGRGCANNCFYCGASRQALSATNFQPHVLYRDPQVVVREINKFVGLGYKNFAIVYNPENDYSYYLKLFEMIRAEKIKIGLSFDSWFIPSQRFIDDFSKTFDLNYSALCLTIESGSPRIRRQFNKLSVTNEEILNLLEYIDEKGIFTDVFFSAGLPNETKTDMQQTIDLALKIRKRQRNIHIVTIPIEPGSPMAVHPEKFNIKIHRKTLQDYMDFTRDMAQIRYPQHPLGYSTVNFSENELQKIRLDIFRKCYLNGRFLKNFFQANKNKKRFITKLFCGLGVLLRSPRIFYKYTPGSLG